MRSVLICHAGDRFDQDGLAAWLASFSELAGVVVLRETGRQKRARYRRELRRSGWLGFADVAAMRLYQRAVLAGREGRWLDAAMNQLEARYGRAPAVAKISASHVNAPEVAAFVREAAPDLLLARCKQLIRAPLIDLPRLGAFVMHPGICPEYRNAHGCFWALAQRDLENVGMTLLRIDSGIDTGPVYGHYRYRFDERRETYAIIQYRVVLENLDAVAVRLGEVANGKARPVDVSAHASAVWGQPRLSRYLRWRRAARRAP